MKKGTQIIYTPLHTKGDLSHSDCEPGFVSSVRGNTVFCRYWSKYHNGLRTQANSEGTDQEMIVVKDTVPQSRVERAIEEFNI